MDEQSIPHGLLISLVFQMAVALAATTPVPSPKQLVRRAGL
jgi:hypothetical protein